MSGKTTESAGQAASAAPEAVVEAFLQAVEGRDFDAASRCLSSGGFVYLGPTRRFDRADAYLAHLVHLALIMKGLHRRRTFVNGPDVCVIMDFRSTMPEFDGTRIAQWFTVSDGRITRIEAFLDASPYNRLFAA
jgi:hypothetical protein